MWPNGVSTTTAERSPKFGPPLDTLNFATIFPATHKVASAKHFSKPLPKNKLMQVSDENWNLINDRPNARTQRNPALGLTAGKFNQWARCGTRQEAVEDAIPGRIFCFGN